MVFQREIKVMKAVVEEKALYQLNAKIQATSLSYSISRLTNQEASGAFLKERTEN